MNQKKISQEYEKAIQYIYELMKSGELTIGSRLPTEACTCRNTWNRTKFNKRSFKYYAWNGTYRTPSGFW